MKEKSREHYKNLSQEEKDKIKEYQRKKYQELVQYKKEVLKNKYFFVFSLIQQISEKTLKFGNIRVNKKEFHKSKQPIDLMSVNINQIVVSGRFKHSDKYFENGGKNLSFMVKDDNVLDKYNKIWDKIKETLNIKFHNKPVYDETYIKVKVREFDSVVKANFLGNELPKGNMHYACIACITIDSVMKMDKKPSTGLFRGMQI